MTTNELMDALALFPDGATLKSYAELQAEVAQLKEANRKVAELVEHLVRELHKGGVR